MEDCAVKSMSYSSRADDIWQAIGNPEIPYKYEYLCNISRIPNPPLAPPIHSQVQAEDGGLCDSAASSLQQASLYSSNTASELSA
jgi:hypothetical protein